jgi:glucose/arabinose dehydrogenase
MPNANSLGTLRIFTLLTLAATMGACAGTGPSGSPAAGEPTPGSPVPVTSVLPSSAAAAPGAPGAGPDASGAGPDASGSPDRPDLAAVRVAVETTASGLTAPLWAMAAGDGSGRLFIVEQAGRIRVLRDGSLLPTPFLDISDHVGAGGERGLLGLAFAPGFGTGDETRFYVHYSDAAGDTTIAELRATAGTDTADPTTERLLLTERQPYPNHNGGWIGFDRSGMLLVALGDGGSGGDPENRASNLGTILGKILRLDVLGAPEGDAYAVPADNPFIGRSDARPEILHFGLRNPFRASVDPVTGTLWIGDVGQNLWEEVDAAPEDARGLDFGWHRWEGRHCYEPATGCDPAGVTEPVTEYGHGAGCSVIGGVVYRGSAIPALRGAYLFSDYCSGTLWAIDAGLDAPQAPIPLLETGRAISSIGTDEAAEVVLTDLGGGELLRLVPAG